MIRTIVLEQLQLVRPFPVAENPAEKPDSLQQDIAAMLDNLDFFQ